MSLRPSRRLTRTALLAAASCALALALGSCSDSGGTNDPPPFGGGVSAPLEVDCLTNVGSVLAGSSPILVTAQVTRGGAGVSGAVVTFAPTRGLVQPTEAMTDATGVAFVQYTPPATTGDVRIDVSAEHRSTGDSATGSCTVGVTDAGDPRLNVQLIVPDQAAGIQVQVQYDPARVDLPAGAARSAGPYAGPGCITLANDNDFGIVRLDVACSTLQAPAGTVATFDFVHLAGGELRTQDFTVTCQAFDEQGRALGAACSTSITQL